MLEVSFRALHCDKAVCLGRVFDALEEMRLVVKAHLLAFEVFLVILLQFYNLRPHFFLLFFKEQQVIFIDLADRLPDGAQLVMTWLWALQFLKYRLSLRQIYTFTFFVSDARKVVVHRRALLMVYRRE